MATPIYNIPIGEGGKYTYYTNIAPIYKAPALAPYLWGASPLSVSPLIYGYLAAGKRGSEPSPKYKRFFNLAAIPSKKISTKILGKLSYTFIGFILIFIR